MIRKNMKFDDGFILLIVLIQVWKKKVGSAIEKGDPAEIKQ